MPFSELKCYKCYRQGHFHFDKYTGRVCTLERASIVSEEKKVVPEQAQSVWSVQQASGNARSFAQVVAQESPSLAAHTNLVKQVVELKQEVSELKKQNQAMQERVRVLEEQKEQKRVTAQIPSAIVASQAQPAITAPPPPPPLPPIIPPPSTASTSPAVAPSLNQIASPARVVSSSIAQESKNGLPKPPSTPKRKSPENDKEPAGHTAKKVASGIKIKGTDAELNKILRKSATKRKRESDGEPQEMEESKSDAGDGKTSLSLLSPPYVNGKQMSMRAWLHAYDGSSKVKREQNVAAIMKAGTLRDDEEDESEADERLREFRRQIAKDSKLSAHVFAAQMLIDEGKVPTVEAVRERVKMPVARSLQPQLNSAASEKKAEPKPTAVAKSVVASSSSVASLPSFTQFANVASRSNVVVTAPPALR